MVPNPEPFISSLGIKYPSRRDAKVKTVNTWMEDKRDDDGAEGLWRIHDELYDFATWINIHPGGSDWLKITKVCVFLTAISGSLFEISLGYRHHGGLREPPHILSSRRTPPEILRKKSEDPSKLPIHLPRHRLLQNPQSKSQKCHPNPPRQPSQAHEILRRPPPRGLHNFRPASRQVLQLPPRSHLRRMPSHAYDSSPQLFPPERQLPNVLLRLLSTVLQVRRPNLVILRSERGFYRDWRISHVLSHHLYTNSINDMEISTLEPFLMYLPGEKHVFRRLISIVINLGVCAFVYVIEFLRR